MKCLVVEDIVLLRRITKSTLDRLGASVMECENGEQAVQIVEECLTRNSSKQPPHDFILMDCQVVMAIYYDFYFYLVISFWFCSSILLQIANDIS